MNKYKNTKITSSHWDNIPYDECVNMFVIHFDNATIKPNEIILEALRDIKIATIELLENRTKSSVYRIRETNQVFHIMKSIVNEYSSYDEYIEDGNIVDDLLTSCISKPLPYSIIKKDYEVYILRNKSPKMVCKYNPNGFPSVVEVLDIEEGFEDTKKAEDAIRSINRIISRHVSK